jgi:hypothetical protein
MNRKEEKESLSCLENYFQIITNLCKDWFRLNSIHGRERLLKLQKLLKSDVVVYEDVVNIISDGSVPSLK